jgi:hypothetical protein
MTAGTVVLAGVGVVALERSLRSPDTVQTVPSDGSLPGVVEEVPDMEGSSPTAVTIEIDAPDRGGDRKDGTSPVIPGEPGLRVPIVTNQPDAPVSTTDDETLPTIATTPRRDTTSAPDKSTPTAPAPPSAPATVPSPTTTTPAPTSTEATPTTTVVATTTVPESGERVITSSCGTVAVAYEGTTVTLVETQPASGFGVDVKNSGPEEVEVGFAGGDIECQIKAEMEAGQLVVDVEDPGA